MPDQEAVWDETYEFRKNKFPRLVSEGDSWFAYPVWRSMMDFVSASNLFAIRRRGESGRRLSEIVQDGQYLAAVKKENPKAVMISGGGNDFVNKAFVTGADGQDPMFDEFAEGMTAEDLINEAKWEKKLAELSDDFAAIVEAVDGLPVIVHGYDYILPSGVPARYDGINVAGPWILPTMIARNITDPTLQLEIVVLMIDSFNEMLASVQSAHHGQFFHVDLRGTVKTGEWANEIHPFEKGFRSLGLKYLDAVKAILAGPAIVADGDDR